MLVTWLSPLDLETPAGAGVQVGKEEAKQLMDAGTEEGGGVKEGLLGYEKQLILTILFTFFILFLFNFFSF